jgi:hypothetical protein
MRRKIPTHFLPMRSLLILMMRWVLPTAKQKTTALVVVAVEEAVVAADAGFVAPIGFNGALGGLHPGGMNAAQDASEDAVGEGFSAGKNAIRAAVNAHRKSAELRSVLQAEGF